MIELIANRILIFDCYICHDQFLKIPENVSIQEIRQKLSWFSEK